MSKMLSGSLSPEESAHSVAEARRLLALEPAERTEALYSRSEASRDKGQDKREEIPCGAAAACMLLDRTVLDKADYAPSVGGWSVRQAVREVLEVAQLPPHEQERDMAERLGLDGRVKV